MALSVLTEFFDKNAFEQKIKLLLHYRLIRSILDSAVSAVRTTKMTPMRHEYRHFLLIKRLESCSGAEDAGTLLYILYCCTLYWHCKEDASQAGWLGFPAEDRGFCQLRS